MIEMLTRTPLTAEQVKVDEVGKATLEKLYSAFPETKSFEIIEASNVQVVQTSIVLQEQGGTDKKITLHINAGTGESEHVDQENWEPKEKPLFTLTDQEIKAKVDHLIDKMYGSVNAYEFAMEQMENPNQKVLMLNYIIKGSEKPFYQVFVHDNAIHLTRVGGEPAPSHIKVEGLFTRDGKPDYTYDPILNDDKLFALLQISPTEFKEELAKGQSVADIAASKNISKQQVLEVIANTQVEKQQEAEQNGVVPKSNRSKEQLLKDIEPKLLPILEHKNETPQEK